MLFAATSTVTASSSSLTVFLPIILVAGVYFVFVRPRAQKAKKAQLQDKEVAVGDRVMTTSGLFGRVSRLTADMVILEVAPDVELSFVKRAIARRIDDEPDATGADDSKTDAANGFDDHPDDHVDGASPNGHHANSADKDNLDLPDDPEKPTV